MARANQPTSFRTPFNLPDEVHPGVRDALKITYNGVKDLNDAIRALNDKVKANTSSITNVTENVAAAAVSPSPTPAPAFGFVNLQPDLTPGAYTLAQSDLGGLILVQSGIAFALTLNSGLVTPFFTTVYNLGSADVTATPSLGNVNNVASVTVVPNQLAIFYFDGTDWWDVNPLLAQTFANVPGSFLDSYDAATGLFTASPAAATVNFADGETVAGSGTAWTLAHTPSPALSLILVQYVAGFGGIVLIAGTDYTLAGAAITTVNSLSAGVLTGWYRY